MDPKLTEVSQLFERFKAAFSRNDFDTCTRLLSQLKVFFFYRFFTYINLVTQTKYSLIVKFPTNYFLGLCCFFYYKSQICLCFWGTRVVIDTGFLLNLYLKSLKRKFGFYFRVRKGKIFWYFALQLYEKKNL